MLRRKRSVYQCACLEPVGEVGARLDGALCQVAHTIIPWRTIHAKAMPVNANALGNQWPVDWEVVIDYDLQATYAGRWHQAGMKLKGSQGAG